MVRGTTSASIGETPIVRIASISSVSFIVPICAAKADPERPATMIAVISTPSSRKVMRPTRLIVKISAPNWRSWTAPCWAMTMPIRKLISPMMPSAVTPTTSKRWTVALKRKRRGGIAMLPNAISDEPRAEKAEQAVERVPRGDDRVADFAEHARQRVLHRRERGDRLLGGSDLIEQVLAVGPQP